MYFRTFYFLLFILFSFLLFISSSYPIFLLKILDSIGIDFLNTHHIQLTSLIAAGISIVLYIITNHYTLKNIAKEQERVNVDRETIEKIHAELEAMQR